MSSIVALYTADTEIQRVKDTRFFIKEQLTMSLKGATKRIDFYEASLGNIAIEYDYIEQFERYIQEALLLDNSLHPLDEKDFGITGKVVVEKLELVPRGYDALSGVEFSDTGLVSIVHVPMNMKILGMDFPVNIPFKIYSEIRN